MRVFVGTDHAGLEFKNLLKEALAEAGHEPVDCGAHEYDPQDDYPPFCFEVSERVVVEQRAHPGPAPAVHPQHRHGGSLSDSPACASSSVPITPDSSSRST